MAKMSKKREEELQQFLKRSRILKSLNAKLEKAGFTKLEVASIQFRRSITCPPNHHAEQVIRDGVATTECVPD
jgi:hypothetical protein